MRGFLYFFSFVVVVLAAIESPSRAGFEFRGLRTGLAETDVEAIFGVQLECIHSRWGRLCSAPPEMKAPNLDPRYRNVNIGINDAGRVWAVNYQFQTTPGESPESFAKAFTAKYGRPTMTTQTYRNQLGQPFSGVEYSWHRGTQDLDVEELCAGELDNHCLHITDAAYGPKTAAPQI
jgi:hypothetical protein